MAEEKRTRKTVGAPSYTKADFCLWKHNTSGVYYVRKFKAGKGSLFKSTGETRLGRARLLRDDMLSKWESGGRISSRHVFVDEIADELLVELRKEAATLDDDGQPLRRKRTLDKDESLIPVIKTLFGALRADVIDEEFWKNWLRNEGAKLDRTLFDVGKYLSKVLTFAVARQYIARKPAIEIPKLKTKGHLVYTDSDIALFVEHSEPMLRDLIMVEAPTGARPHEVRELLWSWLDLTKNRAVVRLPASFTKTGQGREFQLGPDAEAVIRRRFKERAPGALYVFPAPKDPGKPISDVHLSRMWHRMLKAAGIDDGAKKSGIKFHWLRHTFYTKALLDAREPIQHVSEYGGTSIATLQKNYLKSDATRTASVALAVKLNLNGGNKK